MSVVSIDDNAWDSVGNYHDNYDDGDDAGEVMVINMFWLCLILNNYEYNIINNHHIMILIMVNMMNMMIMKMTMMTTMTTMMTMTTMTMRMMMMMMMVVVMMMMTLLMAASPTTHNEDIAHSAQVVMTEMPWKAQEQTCNWWWGSDTV